MGIPGWAVQILWAREVVTDIAGSTLRKSLVADKAHAVLELAAFPLGDELAEEQTVEAEEEDSLTPLGASHEVKCSIDALDGASSRAGRHPQLATIVALNITVDGESGRVLLKPAVARQFAAGILTDADTAEGTEAPLLFPSRARVRSGERRDGPAPALRLRGGRAGPGRRPADGQRR